MKIEMIIGLLGGALTTVSFLPQVVRIWKTRSTKDLSLVMYLIFALGLIMWLTYGFMVDQLPVIVANLTTLVLALIIIIFKLKYK